MSFNGSGTFQINTAGQPVVFNTTIDETVFNALTADLATGLSTCITKDGQTVVAANIPMAGYKITGLGLGTATTDAMRMDNANALSMCEFRLTLTTGVPVTTTDVTGAETVYWTPYKGNRIALFDGTSWHMRTSAELSIDVPDANQVSDVFVYDNAGVATLELTAWTNSTTRATALTTQDGVLVKTGALTRRYVGTFFGSTTGNGQTADAESGRYLYNYYNRVLKPMRALELTNSWPYSSSTIRQTNASAANQLNFVNGWDDQAVSATCVSNASSDTAGDRASTGIGLDSTTAYTTGGIHAVVSTPVNNYFIGLSGSLTVFPGVGVHFLSWNEAASSPAGITTWYGDNNGTASGAYQSGIVGEIWC